MDTDTQKNFDINTTKNSILHLFFVDKNHRVNSIKILFFCVVITYVPMFIASWCGPLNLYKSEGLLKLPFLLDINILCMFIFSFPCLILFILRDDYVLRNSLNKLQDDQVISIDLEKFLEIKRVWEKNFRKINVFSQILSIFVGSFIAFLNYQYYTRPNLGYWITENGKILTVCLFFVFSIFCFYYAVSFYILRVVSIILFLYSLVKKSDLSMLPGHPDKCGGLSPIAQVGLRNQFLLTVLGINLILFWITSYYYLSISDIQGLLILASLTYTLAGPIIFFVPLLPFRGKMIQTKSVLLGEVSQRLRVELKRIRNQINSGSITKEDEELIKRLREIGSVIDELPIWPFDISTRMKFLTAYIIPIIGGVSSLPISSLIQKFTSLF